jgi:hypothetical protein
MALALIACAVMDIDLKMIILFTIVSAGLFLTDLWKNYSTLYSKSRKLKSIHAWNLISSIGQIFFWGYLFLFVFVIVDKLWFYWVIVVDLLIVTTYLNYKFGNMIKNISA